MSLIPGSYASERPRSPPRPVAEPFALPSKRRQRARRNAQRTALVVEADPVARRICEVALASSGFAVSCVESGIAAVAAARESPPELIVIDFQLPDVPWRVAICWLRSNPLLRSIPVLVLAARAPEGVDLDAVQPLAFIRKPLSEDRVREGMATVLR